MADPRIRTIKIKTGVVKRLTKEKTVYEREVEQQKNRIQKYKDDGKDDYEIRKQEEVLTECVMMVPDCQRRLAVAYEELNKILESEQDLKENGDYIAALKVLEEAKLQLPKPGDGHITINMNFAQYQNFLSRGVVGEVPFVTDPRTNVLQSLYNQSNDELWVESWLQQNCIYRPIPKVKVKKENLNISISETQNAMKECLIVLDKLKKTQLDLKNNVDKMSSVDWKQKTVEIGVLKDQFTKIMTKYENPQTLAVVKRCIAARKKKRYNQKKRKAFRRQQMETEKENREKIHKSIDQWLRNEREQHDKAKMDEDMKKDADCVLAEVTKKKSDARKQLSLILALNKLRFVRDQFATQRGEKVSLEDKEAYKITTDKLSKMWESSLRTYVIEEHGLKLMLEKNANEDSKMARLNKERRLIDEWSRIFFGPKEMIPQENSIYWALTAAERDAETFIAIRKSWDTFLVSPNNEMGSKIPIGWVLPDIQTNEQWTKYLEPV